MKIKLLGIIGITAIILISVFLLMWPEYGMTCNNAVVAHLQKYSNLFSENVSFDTFAMEEVGYPFGVHSLNIQECVNFVFENQKYLGFENKIGQD